MAAIPPIRFFAPAAQASAAAALAATATPTAATTVTGANGATLTSFSTILGQLLADLGPLAFDTSLTSIGSGSTNTAGASGLVNTVFNLLLFNSLGVGQTTTQPALQQLLVSQLLFSATGTTDTSGLGAVGTEQLDAALAQQQGANNPLLTQLANVSTLPNPILFSASGLAQAFQIGNDTGSPS